MDDYLAEFHRLKAKYAGQIELYIGLEIDYLNEESNPSVVRFRELDVYKRQIIMQISLEPFNPTIMMMTSGHILYGGIQPIENNMFNLK